MAAAGSLPGIQAALAAPAPKPAVTLEFRVVFLHLATPRNRASHHLMLPRFVLPSGPYLRLSSAAGPPVSRMVLLQAGHLPPRSPVTALWTTGTSAPIISTAYQTDGRGNLQAPFDIPAAQPGVYRVLLEVNGFPLVSAPYAVVFSPRLGVSILPDPRGQHVSIDGRGFISHTELALVATLIPNLPKKRARTMLLGTAWTDARGRFTFAADRNLGPGEYAIQAVSMSGDAVQTAETFGAVVT